jgi:hypothetical protein
VGAEPFADRNAETGKLMMSSRVQSSPIEPRWQTTCLEDAAVKLGRPDGPTLNPQLEAELNWLEERRIPATGVSQCWRPDRFRLRISRLLKRFGRADHGLYTTVMEEVFHN